MITGRQSLLAASTVLLVFWSIAALADEGADETAIVTGSSILVSASHASDGTERAHGGPPRFFGAMGAQATSYNGYQYVIYYSGRDRTLPREEAYSEVVVARRKLGGFDWQRSTLKGYRVTSDDAHNRQAIAVSAGDGVIHIAFDHHATPEMRYAASMAGVASDPGAVRWDDNVFRFLPNLGDDPAKRLDVTYPEFTAFPGGNLIVYFRTGGSYGGDMRVAKYDATTSSWGKVHIVSSRYGTYKGLTTTRGPYLANGMQVGRDGSLHMAWLFREKPCDFTTASHSETFCNHGLYYAQSRDEGRSWLRADGTQIADTQKGETISIDNIGGPVVDVPKGLGPSNPGITSAVDPVTGAMHVLLNHLPEPGAAKSSFFHYVGSTDGIWTRSQTNFAGSNVSLAFIGKRLYAFVGRDKGQIYFAEREGNFRVWKRMPIKTARKDKFDLRGGYITWDLSRLDKGGATILWHREPEVRGVSSAIEVFDIALQ
ncbi:BNR-4 repeat-containing protein [Altererythrobacter sp. GH1-8]|uniref:BNR-4 repeat-containing protein n=1 Tax=Altererythrobacter sp. GH1-8 TaxID=3349333 RepID=UPI00374DB8B3